MNCPNCGCKTQTADTRQRYDSVRRRRECVECKHRFYTVEIDEDYYKKLEPISKRATREAIQEVLFDCCEETANRLYRILKIK